MKVLNCYFSDQEKKDYIRRNEKVDFESQLSFLNAHNGLRRGKLHLFIAPTGVGKSTFVRTLLRDIIINNPDANVFVWLTEESIEEFKIQLSYGLSSDNNLKNIQVFSEQDSENGVTSAKLFVTEYVLFTRPDIIICDNITTSRIYAEKNSQDQSDVAHWLKRLAGMDAAIFVIAHTGAEVRENQPRLIDENDIRGSKAITNLVEFLYILQPIWVESKLYQFLKIKKHRGQNLVHSLYALNYNKELRLFHKETSASYEQFKELFGERNKPL